MAMDKATFEALGRVMNLLARVYSSDDQGGSDARLYEDVQRVFAWLDNNVQTAGRRQTKTISIR